jgi:hypothetical protein
MKGNITREVNTAALEAMIQVGTGGATMLNVDCGGPAAPAARAGGNP